MKKQNGITLVALIITIIVLLILAVVAIGAVQDSDILIHAENAVGGYNNAIKNEQQILQGYVDYLNNKAPKKTAAEIVSQKNDYILANPTEYASETNNNYGDTNDAYILYKAVDLIEDELGFSIQNRELNVSSLGALDVYDGTVTFEEVDVDNSKYNFIVPVTYNGTDYTLVINVYYAEQSAILGISLR